MCRLKGTYGPVLSFVGLLLNGVISQDISYQLALIQAPLCMWYEVTS